MANYLYNGAELPDIDTVWTDKEAYPYAFIQTTTNGGACLRLSSGIPYCDGTYIRGENISYKGYDFFAGETVWAFYKTTANYTGPYFGIEHSLWASADILNEDGTVYLAASEPVPVGNNITIPDKASFMLGYLTGQRLRKMRVIEPVIEATQTEDELYISSARAVQIGEVLEVW